MSPNRAGDGAAGGDPFTAHRSLLFTVAYEMLGSAADAEDVVQETWLRWAGAKQADVRDPRAYLVRAVTRQALDRLRTVARQREDYIGPWLPEPLLTAPDAGADAELAENVSIAMLTVLETLSPAERAVFVLHEVFDTPYDDIAAAVGKAPAAVRQIAHRARQHVAARRPRMHVDRAEQAAVVAKFLAAVAGGDIQALMAVLAPDVVMTADGGGRVQAARKPITGAQRVAGFLARAAGFPDFSATTTWVNGAPGIRFVVAGSPTLVSVAVENGQISQVFAMRNPDKLRRLESEAELRR